MYRVAVVLTTVVLLSGCTGGELKPELMGTTAKCHHDAKQKFEVGSDEYKSATNVCMWAKASDLKD